jgi:hypothetical protein
MLRVCDSVKTANAVESPKYLLVRVFLPLMVRDLWYCYFPQHRVSISYIWGHSSVADEDDEDNEGSEASLFSCHHNGRPIELHAHDFAEHVLYHVGWDAFSANGSHNMQLTPDTAEHWKALTKLTTRQALTKLPKLKIPGGKMK